MADTPNLLTINLLNNLFTFMDALGAAFTTAQSINNQWSSGNLGQYVNAFTTRALVADGTLAAAPDAAPVATNPVDVEKYPTLERALSPNDFQLAIQFIGQYILFMQGQSASYPSTPSLFAQFTTKPPITTPI